MGVTGVIAWTGAFTALFIATAGALPAGQLPPVPGYIPVYIQSGDSPPDVQRLYESHRTLAAQALAPAPAPAPAASRRTAQVVEAPVAAPSSDAAPAAAAPAPRRPAPAHQKDDPRQQLRSRLPAAAAAAAAAPAAPAAPAVHAPTPNRITKKGAAPLAPAQRDLAQRDLAASDPTLHKISSATKKRAGTRVQYQQQQKAAQTRKRQHQLRSAKQQQQQQPQQKLQLQR